MNYNIPRKLPAICRWYRCACNMSPLELFGGSLHDCGITAYGSACIAAWVISHVQVKRTESLPNPILPSIFSVPFSNKITHIHTHYHSTLVHVHTCIHVHAFRVCVHYIEERLMTLQYSQCPPCQGQATEVGHL